MTINKKTLLGRTPDALGVKDAMHVAIVSLRAGQSLKPGQHITLNAEREAIKSNAEKSFGIVDPFLLSPIGRGESFWGVLNMQEVPTVRHDWDHAIHSFDPPEGIQKRNPTLVDFAEELGVAYDALMAACRKMVTDEVATPYSGSLTESQFDKALDDFRYEGWSEWAEETGYEFKNVGTDCCPEYDYPSIPFTFVAKGD